MNIFNIFKNKKPEWAEFFSAKEYKNFLTILKNHFKNIDDVYIDEDQGVISCENSEYGLVNMA